MVYTRGVDTTAPKLHCGGGGGGGTAKRPYRHAPTLGTGTGQGRGSAVVGGQKGYKQQILRGPGHSPAWGGPGAGVWIAD